jgi:hypothetical protein
VSDEELLSTHELLRQQNAILGAIAKHTRLQYILTCVLLGVLTAAAVSGVIVMIADLSGVDVNKVVAITSLVVLVLGGLTALAKREEKQARGAVARSRNTG